MHPQFREDSISTPLRVSLLALLVASPLAAQRLDWHTRVGLYADNTEFFTPYRVGETILGGQLSSWLDAQTGARTALLVGFFADRRSGSENFVDSIKPVLGFRYHTPHSFGALGTIATVDRHGLLEPLMVTTRELTTPVEYGGQWIENRKRFHGETWINWQKLNTPTQREQYELGSIFRFDPADQVSIEAQHLWYHRGGQLYDPVPVTNNHVEALGLKLHDSLGTLGNSSLAVWELWSTGHIDPAYPAGRPDKGHGTLVRAAMTPWNWAEIFAMHWWGTDFNADAGDNNYNSTGHDPSFYRSDRKYTEIGMKRMTPIEGGVTFDAEFRFHQIDDLKSIAFFNSRWEISYRLVIRAPIDVVVRH